MTETGKPIPPKEPQAKGGRSTDSQPEVATGVEGAVENTPEDVIDDSPDAHDIRPEDQEALHNEHRRQTETTSEFIDGASLSDQPTRDPRPKRRKWVYPTILVVILILGGVLSVAVYLTGVWEREELNSAFDQLETGITRNEAELLRQSSRIEEFQATLADVENRIVELQAAQEEESGRITNLQMEVERFDSTAIAATLLELKDASDTVKAELDRIDGIMSAVQERVEDVGAQPIPVGKLPEEIVNAYDRQLAEVLGAVDERFGEMRKTLDAGMAEIEAAREVAALSEQGARQAERAAEAREALARIVSALNSGMDFTSELRVFQEKSGLEPPELLVSIAKEGVPTRDELASAFPEVAREALNAATKDAVNSGDIGPVRAFLRTQLGLRSLEPREGDSPDAVLSRAEAATRADDLNTALTEITALPQAGRDQFRDWTMLAQRRRDALDAVMDLSAQLDN